MQHTSGMARSHNILANETVRALSYITADIKQWVISCNYLIINNSLGNVNEGYIRKSDQSDCIIKGSNVSYALINQ